MSIDKYQEEIFLGPLASELTRKEHIIQARAERARPAIPYSTSRILHASDRQ